MRLKTREWERKLGTVDVKKKAESGIILYRREIMFTGCTNIWTGAGVGETKG